MSSAKQRAGEVAQSGVLSSRQRADANRVGSSNAKGKQPARPDPDSSPELSEDDSEFELSDDIKAKLAKLEESSKTLTHPRVGTSV